MLYFSAVAIFQALVERFAFLDYANGRQDVGYRRVAVCRCPVLMMAEGDSTVLSRFPQRDLSAPRGTVRLMP